LRHLLEMPGATAVEHKAQSPKDKQSTVVDAHLKRCYDSPYIERIKD